MTNKHIFVICAYKESKYLEGCICSVLNQSVKSKVLISTSTDNIYIKTLAEKYNIPYIVGNHKSDIALDWNFAYHNADSDYVTIVHQDDIYDENYLENALRSLACAKKPLIFFSGYYEIRENRKVTTTSNLKIKRILLLPLKSKKLRGLKFIKRRILSLGNPICCPAVTYVKKNLPEYIFKQGFKSNIDWEAWELISKYKGEFVYQDSQLMGHRVHQASTTTQIIESNLRTEEDLMMLCKFWPKSIAKLINKIYKNAEKSNEE